MTAFARSVERSFTCKTPVSGRVALSRIDYILAKGWGPSPARACSVDDFLVLSRHQLLWADIGANDIAVPDFTKVKPSLFNIRRASPAQIQRTSKALGQAIDASFDYLQSLSEGSNHDLDDMASSLVFLAERSARRHLPMTGRRPFSNARLAFLQTRRKRLCELRSVAVGIRRMEPSFDRRKWAEVSRGRHSSIWLPWGHPADDWTNWIAHADQAIRDVRREEREVKREMHGPCVDDWRHNQEAEAHKMIRGRRADLLSVVDPSTNKLTRSPDDLKRVLRSHFQQSLNTGSDREEKIDSSTAAALATVYSPKADVNPAWFAELMSPTADAEVLRTLRSGKYIVAPGGADRISTGLWRALAERDDRVLSCLVLFLNSCVRLSHMPECGKASIISPILKAPERRAGSV